MKRSEIREHIFKLVFCMEFHVQEELQGQLDAYYADMPEITEEERSYIAQKFFGVSEKLSDIDGRINAVAKGWKTERMGKAELAIIRLAVYEMLYDEDVPVKVAINEAVELAKKFGGDDSPAFVNGILAKLA